MSKIEQLEFEGIRYLLFYPENYVEGKKYPVVFHLHGSGGRGINFKEFKGSIILDILHKGDSPLTKGFFVIPQCHTDTWFDIFNNLLNLVQHVYNEPFTDKKRFSISGISMGGYTSYQVLMSLPKLFNKALICCGGGMYWNSGRIKHIKFRIFHGENDVAVYPEESKRMYARLLEANADVTLTIYPDCDHNCWEKTYYNYDNLQWLVNS